MAINNKPLFTGTPAIGIHKFTNANYTSAQQIFPTTPSTWTEGFYAQKIRIKLSSGATTAACVFSLAIYPGSGAFTPLYDELTIPATTFSNTSPSPIYEIPLNIAVPSPWYLQAVITGSPGASFTFDVIAIGGTYTAQ